MTNSLCVYMCGCVCVCACVRVSGQPYLYRAERERVIDRWSEITVLSSAENSPPDPVSPPPPSSFSFHPITPSCYLSIKRWRVGMRVWGGGWRRGGRWMSGFEADCCLCSAGFSNWSIWQQRAGSLPRSLPPCFNTESLAGLCGRASVPRE